MKKYIITTERTIISTVIIEAESEQEAIEIFEENEDNLEDFDSNVAFDATVWLACVEAH